jgi:hypothetical protein
MAITFLSLAGTGLATRKLAQQWLPDGPATLAGCAALFSGYALFTAYERSDFGELTGGFWIPLLLLLILRERNRSGSVWRRAFDGSAILLAAVVAGTWLSNPPLGVMASYLLGAVALVVALLRRSWAPVLRAMVGAAIGLGLSAFYLVPAAIEQRWIDVREAVDDPGYLIENSWLFARHGNPALELHDLELLKASAIATTMIAVAFVSLAICLLRGRLPGRRDWWVPLALIPAVVLFLQFPISDVVWRLLPKLRFLQFPWRWLVAVEAPMGIFFASALWVERSRWRFAVLAGSAGAFAAATLVAGLNFFQPCDPEDAVWSMVATYRAGTGFEGTDEYTPPFADNSLMAMGLPAACLTTSPMTPLGQGAAGADLEWSPDQGTCDPAFSPAPNQTKSNARHFRVGGNVPHAGFLVLRLRSYPAWRIRLNGALVEHLPERTDGLIVVPVQQGPVEITADWSATPDILRGRGLSGLALALMAGVFILERRVLRGRLS